MKVQAYLSFNGRCEEAIDFYRQALGAQVAMLMRYKEAPEPPPPGTLPPDSGDKIMHAAFSVGETMLMASDGHCDGKTDFEGFSLSIAAPDAATAERMFNALADGGQVQMPLAKTFWSPCFGMVSDRFGIGWMVTVEG